MAGVEFQVDWTQANGGIQFRDILGVGEDRRSVAACNTTESIARAQPGGKSMMAFGNFSQHICPVDGDASYKDSTGLGRWCFLVAKCGSKTIKFVSAYIPFVPSDIRQRGI